MAGRRSISGAVLLGAIAALLLASPAVAARPNVVVVVTDDQTLASFDETVMPKTTKLIAGRGTTFGEGIVSTPQCCPSRAAYLTGQYAQNNGVTSNRPGYPLLKKKRSILPGWLRAAGYRTIHIGKYLNGYSEARRLRPGPGWDHWKTLLVADYQRPVWSIDGRVRSDESYLTTVLNGMVARTARRYAKRRKPFYMQVDHLAPHIGSREEEGRCGGAAVPSSRHESSYEHARVPRNPATEESDFSDKPGYLARRPHPDSEAQARSDLFYGCALGSLKSVDEGVASLFAALRAAGELRNTMVVFTSDNGYSFLEHRVLLTKGMPYEEHLRVPFVIRPPRGHRFPRRSRRGRVSNAPVVSIDLAPTILALARARPCLKRRGTCRRLDGRSLLPLLRGKDRAWTDDRAIRTSFYIHADAHRYSCRWDGLRTPALAVVNHTELPSATTSRCTPADEWELYDLDADPFQLNSAAAVPADLVSRLKALRRCSGIAGRDDPMRRRPFCE